jgi:CHAD domain-containing protein
MKQKKIAGSFDKKFESTAATLSKITPGFDMEEVHDFRTSIKKLRALFRLINVKKGRKHPLKILGILKVFYSHVGTIRNLQLQLKIVESLETNSAYTIAGYREYLEKIHEKWKATAMHSYENIEISAEKEKLLQRLPRSVKKVSLKVFLKREMASLRCLVKELPGEDVLHTIRKVLKDVLYNWKQIRPYKKLLPAGISGQKRLKAFTELIGIFLDKSIAINLLETYCRDCEENGLFYSKETGELQEIEEGWKREQDELLQVIYVKLELLELIRPAGN